MTGSGPDGTFMDGTTCADWTSNLEAQGGPRVGHSDGMGPMMSTEERYVSWNSSHTAPNCSAAGLAMVGGAGRYYCFAK